VAIQTELSAMIKSCDLPADLQPAFPTQAHHVLDRPPLRGKADQQAQIVLDRLPGWSGGCADGFGSQCVVDVGAHDVGCV
jgi:hypothetical protein